MAARINPIRFSEAEAFDVNDVLDKMQKAAALNVESNVEALEKPPARGHTVPRAYSRVGALTPLPRSSLPPGARLRHPARRVRENRFPADDQG